ncbi:hypothetical protein LZ554_002536 [Drepanopeziza brunnea f. sp. 'monogermtubi']|nr:hypothetical protein LZ554_002536 [Drepanopeziza brunnea f. sp. 'monogermtubi']
MLDIDRHARPGTIFTTYLTQDENSEVRSALEHFKVHFRNTGVRSEYPNRNSTSSLSFHTDGPTDVMTMQTRGCAAEGRDSMLASSEMVYNELVRTRPDVVCLLAKPDWPADVWDPNLLSERRASLFFHEGKIILNFSAALIKAHARSLLDKNQPLLSTAQLDALETVFATASTHHHKVSMQPGDLQFVNNCAILHAREPFQDDNVNTRHLVLRSIIFDGDEDEGSWEIEPMPGKKPPLPYCLSH